MEKFNCKCMGKINLVEQIYKSENIQSTQETSTSKCYLLLIDRLHSA